MGRTNLNWERERVSPSSYLLPNLLQLLNLSTCNLRLEILELVGLLWQPTLDLDGELDQGINKPSNPDKCLVSKSSRSHSRGSDTETTGRKSRLITWDRVLVAGNVSCLENRLNTSTIELLWAKVKENHV